MVHLDSYISIGSGGLLLNQQQWQQQVGKDKGKTQRLRGDRNQGELGKWKKTLVVGTTGRSSTGWVSRHGNAEIEVEREDPHALPFLTVNLKSLGQKESVILRYRKDKA